MKNEPAFPMMYLDVKMGTQRRIFCDGPTKREYFAAKAMQGLIPNYRTERSQEGDDALAYLAVRLADALITALEGKEPGTEAEEK